MGVIYLESSALLAWILGEETAPEIAARLDAAAAVATSSITLVEARRALARLAAEGGARAARVSAALGKLERVRAGWVVMTISPEIEERAGQPFPHEPVRTLDAIHLATALQCARVFEDVAVLALDRRILDNAEALGLS